jgi:hypothetical protein
MGDLEALKYGSFGAFFNSEFDELEWKGVEKKVDLIFRRKISR